MTHFFSLAVFLLVNASINPQPVSFFWCLSAFPSASQGCQVTYSITTPAKTAHKWAGPESCLFLLVMTNLVMKSITEKKNTKQFECFGARFNCLHKNDYCG